MNIKTTFKLIIFFIGIIVITCSMILPTKESSQVSYTFNYFTNYNNDNKLPPSLEMYYNIEKNSKKYNIPKHIIYNIVYNETNYKGPFDWNYDPSQENNGAQGPMQIITKYSHQFSDEKLTDEKLKNNIKLNLEVGCRILSYLYDEYGRWDMVLGCYNTGKPIINYYSSYGSKNFNYKKNWIYHKL